MAVYAIGDVQGCDDELQRLLDRIRFDPKADRVWFVGDLVNRGPASLAVLRRVRSMGTAATIVLGNHDLHLLAVALTPGAHTRPKDTLDEVFRAPDRDELLFWLRQQPLLHHDASLGFTMVHAGLAPQWDLASAIRCARELETALRDDRICVELFANMYGDQPRRWSEDLSGFARLRFITNCLTRLRYCTADGSLELKHKGPPQQAPAGIVPWFRLPERRSCDLRIVCGHWSALGFHDADGVLSIDTGCVWGAQLCAVRLDRREPPVFVPCTSSKLRAGDE